MKGDAQKNILFLATAGLIFVGVNVVVLMVARSGQLAPINNFGLWGAFAALNVCSVLWAVSLLGSQPLIVAFSYVAGGFLAYQGVRLLPNANMVEVTTAGATYGAFGVMVVGNVATRVRLAFFNKTQVPFVFVMIALLVMDGFLNSRVSASDWNVILCSLVIPFVFAGIVVGGVSMLIARFGVVKESTRRQTGAVADSLAEPIPNAEETKLVIKRPEGVEVMAAKPKKVATVAKVVVQPAPEPEVTEPSVVTLATPKPVEEEKSGNFFPLEIDKSEAVAPPPETPNPGIVESTVEELTVPEPKKAPSAGSRDWLSDQLEMLNNLKKKEK